MSLYSCRGPVQRREFLRAGALAFGGIQLADLLAASEQGGRTRRNTSVILFWMWGGPSQFETWDPKPDAPREYRGPLGSIETSVPGVRICDVFPRQAQLAHRFSLIRSLHHEMSAHNDGSIEVLTGKTPAKPDPTSTAFSEHPDFGMVASQLRGSQPDGLPQYVGIPRQPFMTRPTYLGAAHSAVATGDPSSKNYKPPNLSLSAGVDGTRLADRRHLQVQFDRMRRDIDRRGTLQGVDQFRDRALEMLLNPRVAQAFDLSREDDATRERYGRHLWGQAFLLARRLATSGVSVITIDALAPTLSDRYFSWDDHINPMTRWDLADAMRYRAPFMDQPLSALIEDMYEQGLSDDVLVVALGEFGRTPRIVEREGLVGRDHWPQAQCALVSGGGLRMGQAIGATNSKGEYPAERPLRPQDLLATIYRHLGIDYRQSLTDFSGRPVPILNDAEPIRELI